MREGPAITMSQPVPPEDAMPNLPRYRFEFDAGGHRARLPWRRRNARVAAAQAVIAVCLELPLESVDILVRAQPLSDGEIDLDGGCATLRAGSTDEWFGALPDVEAADNLLL